MYFFKRFLRFLILFLLVAALFAAVGYYIFTEDLRERTTLYQQNSTLAVQTAVSGALFDATRTMEGDQRQFRYLRVESTEALADVAERYNTTVEVLRMANNLLPSVDFGDGTMVVVPEGVRVLDPPRRYQTPYVAFQGDTLESVAARFNIPLEIIRLDNPVLVRRGVIPGDQIFVAELLLQ